MYASPNNTSKKTKEFFLLFKKAKKVVHSIYKQTAGYTTVFQIKEINY